MSPATKSRAATPKQPKARVVTVTPELAEEWLGRNSHNRPIRQRRVDQLAEAIKRGEWQFNGDAIRFAADGTLLDGQHRLWAVVMAELPIETLVIDGLDLATQETMDTGARRNLKDALVLRGETNAAKLAAIVAYWWRYSTGQVRYAGAQPTIAQGVATLEEHPGLRESVKIAARFSDRIGGVSQAMVAACHYEFASIDGDDADAFFNSLITGVGLSVGDPIHTLRGMLERQNNGQPIAVGARGSALVHHALFIKAWNLWRDGQKTTRLNWKSGGMKAEQFPEPH